MTEIVPPPSAADIERMARQVIATQAAFKRACEATEAATKAMALAQQELENSRKALHGWLDELPLVVDGFVFQQGNKEMRVTKAHTPQTLANEIESKWYPEDADAAREAIDQAAKGLAEGGAA